MGAKDPRQGLGRRRRPGHGGLVVLGQEARRQEEARVAHGFPAVSAHGRAQAALRHRRREGQGDVLGAHAPRPPDVTCGQKKKKKKKKILWVIPPFKKKKKKKKK